MLYHELMIDAKKDVSSEFLFKTASHRTRKLDNPIVVSPMTYLAFLGYCYYFCASNRKGKNTSHVAILVYLGV